jgi:hypothetical protein
MYDRHPKMGMEIRVSGRKYVIVHCGVLYFSTAVTVQFDFTALPMLLHIAPVTADVFTVSRDVLVCSLLAEHRLLCNHPPCQTCFYFAILFYFLISWPPGDFALALETADNF